MTAAPEALVAAEREPHAPGAQWERDQDTPLFCGSLATLAVRLCVCASWIVADAGETATAGADWGGGIVGDDCALELDGTEAQPPTRKAADRQSTATTTGARAIARTPGYEFKVQVLRCIP